MSASDAAAAAGRRWLVSGYYGAGNLGDEALLAGLLGALRRRGASDVAVLSLDPERTRALHGVRAHHRISGLPYALLRSDVVISGGGGLLQDVTSARSLDYYLAVIGVARALGKRVVVYGQSLGPLGPRGRRRVARALRGVPIGLRDAPSLALAHDLGLDAAGLADAALLLRAPPSRRRDALVLVPRGDRPIATHALARLGAHARARGVRVVALSFHPAQDDVAVAALREALPGVETPACERPSEALALLAGARLVASVRLHGSILATVAGVPHVALAYDPKVRGFAERAGAPCWPAPDDDAGVERVTTALVASFEAPPVDPAARAALLADAERGVDWLVWNALHGAHGTSA